MTSEEKSLGVDENQTMKLEIFETTVTVEEKQSVISLEETSTENPQRVQEENGVFNQGNNQNLSLKPIKLDLTSANGDSPIKIQQSRIGTDSSFLSPRSHGSLRSAITSIESAIQQQSTFSSSSSGVTSSSSSNKTSPPIKTPIGTSTKPLLDLSKISLNVVQSENKALMSFISPRSNRIETSLSERQRLREAMFEKIPLSTNTPNRTKNSSSKDNTTAVKFINLTPVESPSPREAKTSTTLPVDTIVTAVPQKISPEKIKPEIKIEDSNIKQINITDFQGTSLI